jgi:flagellar assembly factor FliW
MSDTLLTGSRKLIFPDGLIGYPKWQRFELEGSPDGSPVAWLQGKDEEGACFLVTEPTLVCPAYTVEVPPYVRAALGLELEQAPGMLCMLVVQTEPLMITANLLGPIVYNPDSGLACQLVLADSGYPARYPVVVTDPVTASSEPGGHTRGAGSTRGGAAC